MASATGVATAIPLQQSQDRSAEQAQLAHPQEAQPDEALRG
ncbi:hypothetical protein V8G57_11705 [Collimonas sp. H4R21]|uniref:Uncharacterized protein n=1 Tax=Collimonas rhizosphaerae TaxID=3126357 RepID=A0ABU9PVN3_9BURK